jgi:dihydrofolate reductase
MLSKAVTHVKYRVKTEKGIEMSKAVINLTMSLDGFVAGPNISPEQPLGEGGIRLHDWFFGAATERDNALINELVEASGAVIVGGRTYKDAIDDGWGGETPFNAPAFVVTHTVPTKKVAGFQFVTDGIESALEQAKAVAGDKQVWLMGGANVLQQYLKAGLVDEVYIHIAPVLFGAGTRLFDGIGSEPIDLEIEQVMQTPQATHIQYRVIQSGA